MSDDDFGGMSLFDLFIQETGEQAALLANGLLALERQPDDAAVLESCMRAAHSLKGAARIVGVADGVAVAHVMEECFVLAQHGEIRLEAADIDILLDAVDQLRGIAEAGATPGAAPSGVPAVVASLEALCQRGRGGADTAQAAASSAGASLSQLAVSTPPPTPSVTPVSAPAPLPSPPPSYALPEASLPATTADADADADAVPDAAAASVASVSAGAPGERADRADRADRALKVAAESLDRMLALSGQALVEARAVRGFADGLLSILHRQRETGLALQQMRGVLTDQKVDDGIRVAFDQLAQDLEHSAGQFSERLEALGAFDRRHLALSHQLYEAALASRMRPFADITGGYQRMVREVARGLGKSVQLSIVGEATQVDRDILQLLDAPLGHLLRNAVDHGIEDVAQRRRAGKTEDGHIRIDARHVAGTLVIEMEDDGGGVDIEAVRAAVIRRKLASPATAAQMSEAELLEFLMLPGFSMRENVTEISGRGVGLDVVQTTVRQVRGNMRLTQKTGAGTRFRLQLPLTLSVMRCLLADVGGEPYAFPLAHIRRAIRLSAADMHTVEGRAHFTLDGRAVALVLASQVFRASAPAGSGQDTLAVIVFGSADEWYGLVVDRFRDERMLVVQPLDPRLGKVPDIAAGSLTEDGAPVLIVDVDDLLRSMARLATDARVEVAVRADAHATRARRKRVLVVDDSLTVRELQRKLLSNGGYDVSVAVDGMEGWNALMADRFDMVVTDVDMPRVDGIELVKMIRRDPEFRSLPVMIVSYKDRAEDRQRGLDAGADHYLAKSSFHDAALLDVVRDLIGEGEE